VALYNTSVAGVRVVEFGTKQHYVCSRPPNDTPEGVTRVDERINNTYKNI